MHEKMNPNLAALARDTSADLPPVIVRQQFRGEYILVLGFRADASYIHEELEEIVLRYTNQVERFASRGALKRWLDKNADVLNEYPRFDPNIEYNDELWLPYGSRKIDLFICSTITREDNGENAGCVFDGEEFARLVLPETPKIILHFKNEYRDSSPLPDAEKLKNDHANRIYHLPRNKVDQEHEDKSNYMLIELVEKLYWHHMEIPYPQYEDILFRT
jgi:hypothetical protein